MFIPRCSLPKPGAKPSADDSGTASASSLPSLPGAGPARPPVHRSVADVAAAGKKTRKLSPLVTKEGGGGGPPAKRIPTLQTVRCHGLSPHALRPTSNGKPGVMKPRTELQRETGGGWGEGALKMYVGTRLD